jgi:hypothetical protein
LPYVAKKPFFFFQTVNFKWQASAEHDKFQHHQQHQQQQVVQLSFFGSSIFNCVITEKKPQRCDTRSLPTKLSQRRLKQSKQH